MKDKVPGWYWLVAIAALLFEALGCFAYYLQVSTDPATLPLDQRAIVDAVPSWITFVYAIAVWVGLVGAIGLLLRRRFAVAALLMSLIAVVVQFAGTLIVPEIRGAMSSSELLGPIVIFVLSYAFWQSSRIAKKRGWLA